MPAPLIADTRAALLAQLAEWRARGETIGLVPTMGALHDGHLELVAQAASRHDRVVTTIFVNPTQFGPQEDLDRYPRDLDGDVARLSMIGCDLVFAPSTDQIYAPDNSTRVIENDVANCMEGIVRPGHFSGVATIVTHLLVTIAPHAAYFGEKDYQQLQLIRRVARDLGVPGDIVGIPTVRAPDGLALSSRNAYLTASQREIAPGLARTLHETAEKLRAGAAVADAEREAGERLTALGFDRVDYVEARASDTLHRLGPGPLDAGGRLFGAAALGGIRITDNVSI